MFSVAAPEPHHFSGTGAVTRCGSYGFGSKPEVKHWWILKMSQIPAVFTFPIHRCNNFYHKNQRKKQGQTQTFAYFQ
jgi:hypothetical protein